MEKRLLFAESSPEVKISELPLDKRISYIFTARSILTVKDALLKTEVELMELMDVPFSLVSKAVAQISKHASPPCRTALSLMKGKVLNDPTRGHFRTHLKALDEALFGGIPIGALTEIVGPAGVGKTQFCLKLAILAAMPRIHGGFDGNVLYIDTENKFNSGRLIEIAKSSFPDFFCKEQMVQQLAARVLVLPVTTLSKLAESSHGIDAVISEHYVKLLIIDSMAAFISREESQDQAFRRYDMIGRLASLLKSAAERKQIPVVVTNQVRIQNMQDRKRTSYTFQGSKNDNLNLIDAASSEHNLIAALGTAWAHAVSIRFILESYRGQRYLKISKSPLSRNFVFAFTILASGIALEDVAVAEVKGDDTTSIHHTGYEGLL